MKGENMLKVTLIFGNQKYEIPQGQKEFTIGRDAKGSRKNDLPIDGQDISRNNSSARRTDLCNNLLYQFQKKSDCKYS